MLFSIQRYLEDYLQRKNLSDDVDQYAVRLAKLYFQKRSSTSDAGIRAAVARIRTAFYRRNAVQNRRSLERDLLTRLDVRFRNEAGKSELDFPGGVSRERVRLQRLPRRSIRTILDEFKHAAESRGVDTMWASRAAGRLRPKPEKIAQGMLSQFVMGVLSNRGGDLLRELASGIGFVDIVIRFGSVSHLVKLKILRGRLEGPAQLDAYMKSERRPVGWLIVFDVRKPGRKTVVPRSQRTETGTINIVCVDVNPMAPSRRR